MESSPKSEKKPPARIIFGALAVLVLIAVLAWIWSGQGRGNGRDGDTRERIGVISSLPLFWAEGDLAQSAQNSSQFTAVTTRLSKTYDLIPVDSWDDVGKQKLGRILLVQPRAFTAAELDKMDRWVRGGGNAVILADPALRWESSYPLGDKRRPLFTSMLSPLFTHWGLELALPLDEEKESAQHNVDGYSIVASAAGVWEQRKLDGNCDIAKDDILARCQIGAGNAVLLADADMIDPIYWMGEAGMFGDGDIADNMDWLISAISEPGDGD